MIHTVPSAAEALAHLRAGRTREAEAAWLRLRSAAPLADDAERAACAGLARRLGRLDEAADLLEPALGGTPAPALLHEAGALLLARWRLADAVALLARAVVADPHRPAHWRVLSDALREQGRHDEAIRASRSAIGLDADDAESWCALGLALLAAPRDPRREAEGRAACRRALQLAPDAAAFHRALALGLLRAGRLTEAEIALARALLLHPGLPEATAGLAALRALQGRAAEADTLFRQALAAGGTMAEALANHAGLLARFGDPAAAATAGRALALKPFLAGPHQVLGVLRLQAVALLDTTAARAAADEAIRHFHRALAADPQHAAAHGGLADGLRLAGHADAAVRAARRGTVLAPGDAGRAAGLGIACQAAGDRAGALAAYRLAVRHQPTLAEVHNNLARLFEEDGAPGRAAAALRRAAALRPADAAVLANLADALLRFGQPAEALWPALGAARLRPRHREEQLRLARIDARAGRLAAAEAGFLAALGGDGTAADAVGAWFELGCLCLRTGRREAAVMCLRRAVDAEPGNGRYWIVLSQALRGVRFTAADEALRADLRRALAETVVEKAHLVQAVVSVLDLDPTLAALHAAAARPEAEADAAVRRLAADGALARLSDDRLLIALLHGAIVTDAGMERSLTALRRALLGLAVLAPEDGRAESGDAAALDDPRALPILCALARQSVANEFVFAETPAETAAVERLAAGLSPTEPDPARLALYAAYRPLAGWGGWALAAGRRWPAPVAGLVGLAVDEPAAEAALRPAIPVLTAIDHPVSQAVRAQYEENAYPRWLDAGLLTEPLPADRALRMILPHAVLASADWSAPEILIAGCGTGREVVWAANQFRGARILAVDLSRASLAHAVRQARRLGLTGVEHAQADILGLGALGRRFDIIQCVGVLHHMADPMAGWRVLAGLLRPHGLMKIGLYSEAARRPVVEARALIAERGHPPTLEGIRRLRRDVLALPASHPLHALARSADFYSVSACRDLLFHVQEHRTTLPAIAAALETLNLDFLGFQFDDVTVPHLYAETFPHDPAMGDLGLWDRLEAAHPHLFAGLYQFWVRKGV